MQPLTAGQILLGRLRIERLLGEGQSGRVYRAHDANLQMRVAVKEFFRNPNEESEATFKQEIKFLSKLRHPCLVKIHDLLMDEETGRRYLVEELVEGTEAGAFLENGSWDDRRSILVQILRGLEYLHQNGVIHLDIKSSNILVSRPAGGDSNPAARILDFGIADEIGRFHSKGVIAGTFPYVAPEVIRGEYVDGRADLYSLGMLLWRSLGRRNSEVALRGDMQGVEPNESVGRASAPKTPRPAGFPEDTPRDFREIIATLLRPDPRDRFHTANQVIRRINRSSSRPFELEPGRLRVPDKETAILTGRQDELLKLQSLAGAFMTKPSPLTVVAITGGTGQGKTALLQAFKRWTQTNGFPIVSVEFPGEGVVQLFNSLITPSVEAAISPLLPYLKSLLPHRFPTVPDPESLGATPEAEKARTKEKLSEALSILLLRRPTILAIDDLGSRPDLCSFLSYYLEHHHQNHAEGSGGRARLLIVAGSQDGDAIPPEMPIAETIHMRSWTQERLQDYLCELLGAESVPSRVVEKLHAHTEGIPGSVYEMLQLLIHRSFVPGEDVATQLDLLFDSDVPPALHLPVELGRVLVGLDPSERNILEWLAASSRELSAEEILPLLESSVPTSLMSTLRRLQSAGWVRPLPRGAGMASELRRRVVIEQIPAKLRESMYLRLADTLVQPDESGSALDRAHLYFLGGRPDNGFQIAQPELQTMLRLSQAEKALEFLEIHSAWGTELPPEAARRYRMMMGQAYVGVSKFPEAVSILRPLVQDTAPPPGVLDTSLLLARAYRYGWQLKEALDSIDSARGTSGERPDLVPPLDALAADILLEQSRYDEAERTCAPYVGEASPCSETEAVRFLHVTAKVHFYRKDFDKAASMFDLVRSRTERRGRSAQHALALNSLAAVRIAQGRWEEAQRLLDASAALSHEIGDLRTLGLSQANLAMVFAERKQIEDAILHYRKAVATFRKTGDRATEARTLYNLATLQAQQAQWMEARETLEEALRLAQELRMTHIEARCRLQLADCFTEQGESGRSLEECERAEHLFRSVDARDDATIARLKLLSLRLGTDPAHVTTQDMDEIALTLNDQSSPLIHAWHRFVRGIFATRANPADAPMLLRQAIEHLARHPMGDPLLKKRIQLQLEQVRDAGTRQSPVRRTLSAAPVAPQEAERPPFAPSQVGIMEGLRWLTIARKISSGMAVEEVLEDIVDSLMEFAAAERGFLIIREATEMRVLVSRSMRQEPSAESLDGFSLTVAEEALEKREPVWTMDALADSRFKEAQSVHDLKLRSVICVPLVARDESLGVVYLDNRFRTGHFSEKQFPVLMALADMAAIALQRARLVTQNLRDQREIRRMMRDLKESKEKIESLNTELEEANTRLVEKVESQEQELEAAKERLEMISKEEAPKYRYDRIIGSSLAVRRALRAADRASESRLPVLILGQSGTGKELFARAIHGNSSRSKGPFVPVNCAALPHDLFESELFGFVRGAFSGADRDKPGLFEVAHGGTLFLDEIGDIPLPLQPKLLRVLQDGVVRRLGSGKETSVDVRIIAATHQDLKQMVQEKLFREDLYYRIRVFQISIPPLGKRREDVPELVAHFLAQVSKEEGKPTKGISEAALRVLMAYSWPGNVRELENTVRYAYALSSGDEITEEDLRGNEDLFQSAPAVARKSGQPLREAEMEFRKQMIGEALRESRGNVSATARALGVDRNQLTQWMKKLSLHRNLARTGRPGTHLKDA